MTGYALLLDLSLSHTYTVDSRCPYFALDATAETARLLRNHRCTLKTYSSGVRVVVPVDSDGAPFIGFAPGARLTFHLRLTAPDFALFTDLSALDAVRAPWFSNQGQAGSSALALVDGGGDDAALPALPPGVFAGVEIALDGADPAAGPLRPRIAFQARALHWHYYLVTDHEGAFSLQAQDAGAEDPPLTFGAPVPLDETSADATGAALRASYPGLRVLRFTSDHAIPCHQRARRLQLRSNGTTAGGALPGPSLHNQITVDQTPALYRVVQYLTRPMPVQ